MNFFLNTVAVVSGVLVPFILLALLTWSIYFIGDLLKMKRLRLERELEEAKKAAPYDDIEFSQPPNPTMFTVRLVKGGEVVYEESYDKKVFL